jgi:hypothetical protein
MDYQIMDKEIRAEDGYHRKNDNHVYLLRPGGLVVYQP